MKNSILELLPEYKKIALATGLSVVTVERTVLNVSMFIRDTGISSTGRLTTKKILHWGEHKLSSGSSPSTIYTYYNSIRSFVRFLDATGLSHGVDVSQIHCRPRYRQRVWLRPAEIRRIISYSNSDIAVLVRLMYTAGLRISEAISITEAHLYEGTTLYITGKGGKTQPVFITSEIHKQLVALSKRYAHGYCFVGEDCQPMNRAKAYYHIKKAMTAAGYPNAYPHSLRHSFCTELLRQGASLAHTSRLMGHSSVSVTQVYEHLLTDDIERAHRKLTRV